MPGRAHPHPASGKYSKRPSDPFCCSKETGPRGPRHCCTRGSVPPRSRRSTLSIRSLRLEPRSARPPSRLVEPRCDSHPWRHLEVATLLLSAASTHAPRCMGSSSPWLRGTIGERPSSPRSRGRTPLLDPRPASLRPEVRVAPQSSPVAFGGPAARQRWTNHDWSFPLRSSNEGDGPHPERAPRPVRTSSDRNSRIDVRYAVFVGNL